MRVVRAHAFGNDFVLVAEAEVGARDPRQVARAACARHTGVGGDGLILYGVTSGRATMRLLNADGSPSELSGNGVRCLAAWLVHGGLVRDESGEAPRAIAVETEAGTKHLELLGCVNERYTFRAAMGRPESIAEREVEVAGERLRVVALRVGNPQCVVLGEVSEARLHRFGRALATHPAFPEGTNVEFAAVEEPGRVRILIWERGVGPTLSSGTGACAAAVAAAVAGGASRDVLVEAPGGAQRVEWCDDELYLTGWAEIILAGEWYAPWDADRGRRESR